jgi:hypothetical protein
VDLGEDGHGTIVQHRCFADGCEVMLCDNCGVTCEFCGMKCCAAHMTEHEGSKICPICAELEREATKGTAEDLDYCISRARIAAPWPMSVRYGQQLRLDAK